MPLEILKNYDLDSMQSDCFHMCEYVESAMNEVKDLVLEDEIY